MDNETPKPVRTRMSVVSDDQMPAPEEVAEFNAALFIHSGEQGRVQPSQAKSSREVQPFRQLQTRTIDVSHRSFLMASAVENCKRLFVVAKTKQAAITEAHSIWSAFYFLSRAVFLENHYLNHRRYSDVNGRRCEVCISYQAKKNSATL